MEYLGYLGPEDKTILISSERPSETILLKSESLSVDSLLHVTDVVGKNLLIPYRFF